MKSKLQNSDAGFFFILSLLGLLTWWIISLKSGCVEAWDSSTFFFVGLPLLALFSGVAGYLRPKKVWRWGIAVFSLHPIAMVVSVPNANLNLLPFTIIAFGFLMCISIFTAYIGRSFVKKTNK